MSFKYGAYVKHFYYLKKGEVKMKNEFKAGDLVFEVSHGEGVFLTRLSETVQDTYEIRGQVMCYLHDGRYSTCAVLPSLFNATPEMREKLVAIWGEDAVPKLPLSPQEITMKLLENQKYQLCRVSNHSTDWKHNKNLKAIVHIGVFGEFLDSNGEGWTYGIPIDNNGNEITEIE